MNFVKKVLIVFAFLIIFFKAKNFYSSIQVSKKYFLVLDNILSENLESSISEYINKDLINKKPQELNQKLQEKFPIIKTVIIERTNPDFLFVKIKIHDPLYQINGDKIFSKEGKFFNKNSYNDNLVKDLQILKVNENLENPQLLNELKNFVNLSDVKCGIQQKDSKYQDFTVEWFNKNKILLTSKSDSNFFILIKHDTILDQNIIEICQKLYQEYLQNKSTALANKKKLRNIVFDLRFFDQIILSEN